MNNNNKKTLAGMPDLPGGKQFINPYSDFAFKEIFATRKNKRLSVSFLNALFEGEKTFDDITLLPVERAGSAKDIKKVIYDAEGESSKKELVIMEMQNAWQHFIINRGIYYAAANLHQQLSPGDKDFNLKELIYICFTNFIFDRDDPGGVIKTVKFNIQENNKIFYNKLTFKYIELPKFKKVERELVTDLDKWLFALTNMENLKEIPVSLQGNEIFEELFRVARLSNLNKKQMDAYQRAEMDRITYYHGLNVAREEGAAAGKIEGKMEGEIEGEKKKQLAIIRKMISKGIDDAVIIDTTEISAAELRKIKKQRNVTAAD